MNNNSNNSNNSSSNNSNNSSSNNSSNNSRNNYSNNQQSPSNLNTIAKILANGIIRLHVKELQEVKTQETQAFLDNYSDDSLRHQKLISSTGLPPLNE